MKNSGFRRLVARTLTVSLVLSLVPTPGMAEAPGGDDPSVVYFEEGEGEPGIPVSTDVVVEGSPLEEGGDLVQVFEETPVQPTTSVTTQGTGGTGSKAQGTQVNQSKPETVTTTQGTRGTMTTQEVAADSAAKIGDTGYATLQAAVNAATSGDTVVLLKDVTESIAVPSGKTLTLDLNGKNITAPTSAHCAIENRGSLTIKDDSTTPGTITGNYGIQCFSDSSLVFESGQVVAQECAVSTVSGVTGASITINGGTFTTRDNSVLSGNGSSSSGTNTWVINGGTFNGKIQSSGYVACGIYAPNDDTWTINGGTFTITNGAGIVQRAGTVTIPAGSEASFITTGPESLIGKVGDSIITVPCAAIVYDSRANYPGKTDASKTVIEGGSFDSGQGVDAVQFVKLLDPADTSQRIEISGGSFSSAVLADFCATGFAPTQLGSDGKYHVTFGDNVAKVGTAAYPTLAAAVAAATEGSTVELLTDVTLSDGRVEVGKSIVIDLGGYTLEVNHTKGNGSAFNITAGTVEIKNGTIDGTEVTEVAGANTTTEKVGELDGICLVTVRSGATLNLSDPSLTMLVKSKNGCCVYAFDGGEINISAGTFENKTNENYQYKEGFKGLTINQANVDTQLVHITGGTFIGNDPQMGDDNGAQHVNDDFIASPDADTEVNSNGTYTVVPGYVVTFDSAGGTLVAEQRIAKNEGNSQTATEPGAPTKEGHLFKEWRRGTETSAFDFTTSISADTELTAQWLTKVDVPKAVEGLEYTGSDQTGVADPADSAGYTLAGNKAMNAGTYSATATLNEGYIWSDGTSEAKTIPWSIAPQTVTITIAQIADQTYNNGAEIKPELVVTTDPDGVSTTTAYANNINAGLATVTVSVTGTTNYTGSATANFTINKAPIMPTVMLEDWTYGEEAKTPSVSGSSGNGSVTYEYKAADAEGDAYSTDVPTDAGSYTVKATIAETTNYEGGTATADFTIAKATIAKPTAKDAVLTYNGSAQTGVDLVEDAGYSFEGTYSATDAGEYRVSVTPDANHVWSDGGSDPVTISWSIVPAEVEVPTATDYVYDGEEKVGVAEGAGYVLGGTAEAKEAGSYEATATPDANHAWKGGDAKAIELSWTIERAPVTIAVNNAKKTLGADDPKLTATVTGVPAKGVPVVYTLSRTEGEAMGSYDIVATVGPNPNYDISVKKGSFTIEAAAKIEVPKPQNHSYTGRYQVGVKYDKTYWLSGRAVASQVGSYTVKVMPQAGYVWTDGTSEAKTLTWTISPAELSSVTAEDQVYTGEALTPTPVVKAGGIVVPADSYKLSYEGNVEIGKATITATGLGNYVGTVKGSFEIKQNEPKWIRLSGKTAYDTMKAVVEVDDVFGAERGGTVIVASAGGYWDALAAAGLAGMTGAPVLITSSKRLSEQTAAEIGRLAPAQVLVAGGSSSVSDDCLAQIRSLCGNVTRVSGKTAVDTAIAVYEHVSGWGGTAIVATTAGYWDALSIAPYAFAKRAPIFLASPRKTLSEKTMAALKSGGFGRVIIVGGGDSVNASVEAQLAEAGIASVRLAGATAIDTSAIIAGFEVSEGMGVSHLTVATASGYWDALSAAAVCGAQNSVLVLANATGGYAAFDEVFDVNEVEHGHVIGGVDAISEESWDYFTTKQ